MKTRLVLGVMAFICTLPASAGVIYRWQDVTPNPNVGAFSGYVEIRDDLWSPDGDFFARGTGSLTNGLEPIYGIQHSFFVQP